MVSAKSGFQLDENGLSIVNASLNLSIPFSEIESAELIADADFNAGRLVKGSDSAYLWVGTFNNAAFGDYYLYCHTDVHSLIAIRYGGGKVLVCNKSTFALTKSFAVQLGAVRE